MITDEARAEVATRIAATARRVRRADLLSYCAHLDDGTGTLGVIVDCALDSDPAVTGAAICEIVQEARDDEANRRAGEARAEAMMRHSHSPDGDPEDRR